MTSPVSSGEVSVEIIADARRLAKDLKDKVEAAFRDLDPARAIRDAITQSGPVQVPVTADTNGVQGLGQRLRAAVSSAVQGVKASVPVDADTSRLPEQVRAAAARAGQGADVHVDVEVDVDTDKPSRALSGIGRMLSGAIPGVSALKGAFNGLGDAISRGAGQAVQLGSSLSGALSSASGPVGIIVGLVAGAVAAMAALSAAAVAAVPAITAVAGAAAAIPGALAGVGAVIGTLGLGFKGIGEAFKDTGGGGGGGGGAVNQARQIAAAARQVEAARRGIAAANRQVEASERSLAAAERNYAEAQLRVVEAQKRVTDAQKAINQARKDAAENIEDLNRALRGAQLSEKEAALGVTDALRELEAARVTGNLPDIQRAELAYQRAQLALEEAKDTAGDLGEATDEANRKGVEGSDEVQDAYRDQEEALKGVRDAQLGVIDAQDSLASAQDGVKAALDGVKSATDGLKSAQDSLAQSQQKVASGGGGVAKEVTKLAPAAQKFVNAIKALKPAFDDLRLDVQQRLFQGLDRTVTNLGNAWIPRLKTTLGAYADTFNGFFKDLGSQLSTTEFMDNIQAAAEGFRQGLEPLLDAVANKLVPAFGRLAKASAPFLKELGEGLAEIVTRFSDWVEQGERSGGLEDFFERASQALREIFAIGNTVASIIGSIFEIITGSQATNPGESPLEKFRIGLQKVADYLANPQNQQKIQDFIGKVQAAISEGIELGNKITGLYEQIRSAFSSDESESLGADIAAGIVTGFLAGIVAQGPIVKAVVKAAFNGVISAVKNLFGIKSPSTVFASIGADVVRGFLNGISNLLGSLRSRAEQLKTTVTNAVAGAGSWLAGTGRNAVGGLMSGISNRLGDLRSRAGQLRSQVTGAVSNASSWLVSAGRNVVRGLWNGIAELSSWLWNRVANFAQNYVTNAIQAALGINSPSKEAAKLGRGVPEGLALGIDADAGLVQAAAERLAASALPQIDDAAMGLGFDADAAITRSLAVADSRTLEARWVSGATGDQVLDAFRNLIKFSYRGDPQLAFGS